MASCTWRDLRYVCWQSTWRWWPQVWIWTPPSVPLAEASRLGIYILQNNTSTLKQGQRLAKMLGISIFLYRYSGMEGKKYSPPFDVKVCRRQMKWRLGFKKVCLNENRNSDPTNIQYTKAIKMSPLVLRFLSSPKGFIKVPWHPLTNQREVALFWRCSLPLNPGYTFSRACTANIIPRAWHRFHVFPG